MSGGRPSILTDELRDDLCKHIASPMAVRHACAMVGLGERTFYDWMQRAEEDDAPDQFVQFAQAVARARAAAAVALIDTISRHAQGHRRTRYHKDGGVADEWLEADPASARWLAERMFPDEYGNRQRIEHAIDKAAVDAIEFDEDTLRAAREFTARASGGYEPVVDDEQAA
ncbi:MAG: hypothetical protein JWL76_2123 [Thermoleophilia bacterium]|nr:hypothetical protein [Thermoleophilia bacterium]